MICGAGRWLALLGYGDPCIDHCRQRGATNGFLAQGLNFEGFTWRETDGRGSVWVGVKGE